MLERKNILIIDDDQDVLKSFKKFLYKKYKNLNIVTLSRYESSNIFLSSK
jgi:DNA-binding NtrC family response regulator